MAALGLHCYAQAFLIAGSRGYSRAELHGLLTAVASLAAELRFQGTWAQSLQRVDLVVPQRGVLLGPGIKSVSPGLAGEFLTTGPPGKSHTIKFYSATKRNIVLVHAMKNESESCSAMSDSLPPRGLYMEFSRPE